MDLTYLSSYHPIYGNVPIKINYETKSIISICANIDRKQALINITPNITELLDKNELQACIYHEIAHLDLFEKEFKPKKLDFTRFYNASNTTLALTTYTLLIITMLLAITPEKTHIIFGVLLKFDITIYKYLLIFGLSHGIFNFVMYILKLYRRREDEIYCDLKAKMQGYGIPLQTALLKLDQSYPNKPKLLPKIQLLSTHPKTKTRIKYLKNLLS